MRSYGEIDVFSLCQDCLSSQIKLDDNSTSFGSVLHWVIELHVEKYSWIIIRYPINSSVKTCLQYIRAASWENQQCGFWPGLTQTRLYSYWRWQEARNSVFRKKRDCTIQVKTKELISFAVTAKLICVFVFAYAKHWVFSRRGSYTNNSPFSDIQPVWTRHHSCGWYLLCLRYVWCYVGGTNPVLAQCKETLPRTDQDHLSHYSVFGSGYATISWQLRNHYRTDHWNALCCDTITLCDVSTLASENSTDIGRSGIAKFVSGYVCSVLCVLQSADIWSLWCLPADKLCTPTLSYFVTHLYGATILAETVWRDKVCFWCQMIIVKYINRMETYYIHVYKEELAFMRLSLFFPWQYFQYKCSNIQTIRVLKFCSNQI